MSSLSPPARPVADTSCYPADLFQRERTFEDTAARWWVLHTHSRAEKSLARKLTSQEVPHYLPVHVVRRKVQRRIIEVELPLFPGYLFLKSDEDGRRIALDTMVVANCLWVEEQSQMEDDLRRIYQLISAGVPLSAAERLQPGMPARITGGPMAGIEGVILQRKKDVRFIVSVNFLQQGAAVEVDIALLQPL